MARWTVASVFTLAALLGMALLWIAPVRTAPSRALPAPAARAEASSDRVALVLGNSRYASTAVLPNAASDARLMAAALSDIGFTVIDGFDLNRDGMERKISEFLHTAENARVRLFYYAGHGLQVDGRNYLVPVTARLDSAGSLDFETVALDAILGGLDSPSHANIIILDACRNNPFAQTLAARSGAAGRGLAPQHGLAAYANVGAGTLIAFSTAPDKVALDGSGLNSPFTEALARHVGTRGLEVRQMLTRVRADVAGQTRGAQIPWDNSALLGDVYLAGPADGAAPPPAAPDDILWDAIKDSGVAAVFDEFVNRFPMSAHVSEARARADELKHGTTVAALSPGTAVPASPTDGPANAPIARFMRGTDSWNVSVSFADAVTSIAWRTEESQNYRETGFMDVLDPRTRRRIPNPMFEIDGDQKATTVWIRAVDANGTTQGPFPIRFDPATEVRHFARQTLEQTSRYWITLQSNGTDTLLTYVPLVTYRCGIRQARIGIDSTVPDRPLILPPCDDRNPLNQPRGVSSFFKVPSTTAVVSVELTYQDGSVSEIKTFRRHSD